MPDEPPALDPSELAAAVADSQTAAMNARLARADTREAQASIRSVIQKSRDARLARRQAPLEHTMIDTDEPQGITDSELELAIEALIKEQGVSARQAATVLGTMCEHYAYQADEP